MTGFMFGPAIGAIVATALFDRNRFLTALGFRPGRAGPVVVWTVWGWLVPVALAALASIVTLVLTRSEPADATAALAAVVEASGQEVPMSPEMLLTLQLAIGVPVGEVMRVPDILAHPQVADRAFLGRFEDVPGIGRAIDVVRIGAMIDGQRPSVTTPPPTLGADSDAILSELGYSADEIEELRAEGVI